ncbi:hypothetical protein [Levilactobacillus brevis]|uniref:hypothetical protein n=1 Tax=Levilactobacillus brevis TaxID=1580 RepID=UPI001BDEFD0F|nr:hypothetical protein [Levilactobacillus brevis]
MQFDTTYLTEAGRSLATGTLGGLDKIQFTRAVASSHDYSATPVNDLKKLTSLEDVQQTVNYSRIIKKDDTTLTMRVDFPSKDVTTAYSLYTVGFYARPENGDEILYGVLPSSLPDYIAAYDGKSNLNDSFQTDTTVSDADNVLITVSQAGSLNEADLDAIFASKHIATIDDIKANIPATVIDGSKPADFKESVTLEKGAVDGAGNAIATTKNVADGDAMTLKSAKEYADTKTSGKADDSTVVHTADMRKPANQVAGMDDVNAKQDKLDYTPANAANVVDRNPDTGTVSEPTDFTNLTVNGGKSVATSDDLKSIEASAWRPIISDNYSGLCMMKYNADIGTMSLSGTIFPKMWSPEGSRSAIIIPLPSGFAMGKNSNAKISLMMRFMNNNVQQFEYALVDLLFETDGIHIVFDKVYAHTQTFIVLDGFFNSDTKETQSSSFIDFKVTKN